MEDRIKVLEELCEMLAKQSIEQNNRIMEINRNLINEIKYLRESFEKKDQEMEELTSMLRRFCDLNARPGQALSNLLPGLFLGPQQGPPPPPPMPPHPAALASLLQQPQAQAIASLLQSQGLDIQRIPPPPLLAQQSPLAPPPQAPIFFNQTPPPQPPLPPTTNQSQMLSQQQQQQQQPAFTFVNQGKPPVQQQQPPSVAPLPPKPQTQNNTPQQQTQANNLFSFKNTSTPPVTQLVPPPPQQQQQPSSTTTHTPAQQETGTKPPLFNFSPLNKPQFSTNEAAAKTTTSPAAPLFGNLPTVSNLFKPPTQSPASSTTTTTTTPVNASLASKPVAQGSPFTFGTINSGNLFKAPEPTKLFDSKTTPISSTLAAADSTTIGGDEGGGDDNETGGHPEEYEPQIDYKPIVKLSEVEVKTGEEDENVLLKLRCKLFRFDQETKEWKEKGVGDLKILQHKQTQSIRILMRRDQVLKLCANHKITGDMKLTEINPKQLSWMAVDFSEEQPKSELLLGRFKDPDDAAKFKAEFEKAVKFTQTTKSPAKAPTATTTAAAAAPNSLSLLFKTDGWKCTACYAPNKADSNKCACCQTPKPGATQSTTPAASSSSTPAPAAPGPFSFGLQPGSSSAASGSGTKPFSFGTTPTGNVTFPKFEFGSAGSNTTKEPAATSTATAAQSSATPAGGSTGSAGANIATTTIFDKNSLPTFASLAATQTNNASPSTGKAATIFGNTDAVSASPIFKPFSGFGTGFGSGFGSTGGAQPPTAVKPLFGAGAATASPSATKADGGGDEGEDEGQGNPEEYEPQVEFKPLVKLAEVEVVTGEENEDAVFKQRCKLYRFDQETKEWKEKGTGEMKVLKHKTNENVFRILMRRDQVHKLCANHRITRDLKLEIYNEKQVRWHAQDYSEGSEGKHELLAARFRNEEDAKRFKEEVEKAQEAIEKQGSETKPSTTVAAAPASKPKEEKNKCEGLKPALSELFKKSNQWTCDGCYVSNKDEVDKCVACNTPRKGASATPSGTGSSNNSTKTPSSVFGSATSNMSSSIQFGSASSSMNNTPGKITFGTNLFQPFNLQSSQTPTKPGEQQQQQPSTLSTMESIFGAKSGLSFADLASSASPVGFSGGFKPAAAASTSGQVNPFSNIIKNAAAPQPLFGSQKAGADNDEEGGDGGNPEDYEPEVEFKPLVKLQEVEVKTGEEDEEALFKTRCKLYRFDTNTKEWKEKGVGDLKILKHLKKENSYRVLMRRDQVLKVCANHRITSDIKLETMTEKQLRWVANDCSEGHPATEILAVKFRQEEEAKRFKELFEEIQTRGATSSTPSKAAPIQGTKITNNQNNDVIEVYSAKPTAELIEKARSYQLPDNFYLYLEKPGCKGCRGCEKCENES